MKWFYDPYEVDMNKVVSNCDTDGNGNLAKTVFQQALHNGGKMWADFQ